MGHANILQGNAVIGQSGGPTAVINQSLAGVVETLRGRRGIDKILGARHAVSGVVKSDFIELANIPQDRLDRIAQTPSAALGSSREKPDDEYRRKVRRKLDAYHRYVQLGCIAQGLLQHLAINASDAVWNHFKSWMRTMKPNLTPSEAVAAQALRSSFPDFLLRAPDGNELKKFVLDNAELDRCPGFRMAG